MLEQRVSQLAMHTMGQWAKPIRRLNVELPTIYYIDRMERTLTARQQGAVAYGCIRIADYSVWCDMVDYSDQHRSGNEYDAGICGGGGWPLCRR